MPKKTNLPSRIVAHLKRHPTATRQELSETLGVSYQAVQKHLHKLEEERWVLPGFVVSDRWEAGKQEFWIFIETRYDPRLGGTDGSDERDYQSALCRAIAEKLTLDSEWAEEISFGSLQILLGGKWDVVLRVFSRDQHAVGRFVTRYLRSQPAIEHTSTAWALEERFGG